jgi:hypothetical protein
MKEQKKWKHLMLDLETLGKTSDAVILSIGAVPFNMDGEMGDIFEVYPTVQDQFKKRKVEWDTIKWWMEQNEQARKSITSSHSRNQTLKECLEDLNCWCLNNTNPNNIYHFSDSNLDKDFKVWANGASFDIAIMRHAFTQYDVTIPWSYKNEYDCRTMVYMSKISTKNYDSVGIKHNAVADCKWQISWLCDAFHILRGT